MSETAGAGLSAIVLAAGHGVRMRSPLPKPLQRIAGVPMLAHVIDALAECRPERVAVVLGADHHSVMAELRSGLELLRSRAARLPLEVACQTVPRGTGDAAAVGLVALADSTGNPDGGGIPDSTGGGIPGSTGGGVSGSTGGAGSMVNFDSAGSPDAPGFTDGPNLDSDTGHVIIVPGDAPLLRAYTLGFLVEQHVARGFACTLLTAKFADPFGYGRVVRGADGWVSRIVEQRDATPEEAAVTEVATSVYVVRRSLLGPALQRISPDNAAGEYYLTDIVAVLARMGYPIGAISLADAAEVAGVNTQAELAGARSEIRRRINQRWMAEGVAIADPANTYIDASVRLAEGVRILPGSLLEGRTVVGAGAVIGPHTRLVDCTVGAGAVVEAAWGANTEFAPGQQVGPFAAVGPAAAPSVVGPAVAPGAVGPGAAGPAAAPSVVESGAVGSATARPAAAS